MPATRSDKSRFHRRAWSWLAFALITLLVIGVYWRLLFYPFVQDDWARMFWVSSHAPGELLRQLFHPFSRLMYRPLSGLFSLVCYRFFGLNPFPYHAAALVIHAVTATWVALIVHRLYPHRFIAVATGLLYATATLVHRDTLIWHVGIGMLGSSFFYFLAFYLFLRRADWLSVGAFGCANLFREDGIHLPFILLGFIIFGLEPRTGRGSVGGELRRVLPFVAIALLSLAFKSTSPQFFRLPEHHPYHLSISFADLLRTFFLYVGWTTEAALGLHGSFVLAHEYLVAGAGALFFLGLAFFAWRSARGRTHPRRSLLERRLCFLAVWFLAGLFPALLIVNHPYRYYLAYAFPAALAGYLISADILLRPLGRQARRWVVGSLVLVHVGSSAAFLYRDDQRGLQADYVRGTNPLIQRAATVRIIRAALERYAPRLPAGATLVFEGVDVSAFATHWGPRLWYGDATLSVFPLADLAWDPKGLHVKAKRERSHGASGVPKGKIYLDLERLYVFRMSGNTVTPLYMPGWERPGPETGRAREGSLDQSRAPSSTRYEKCFLNSSSDMAPADAISRNRRGSSKSLFCRRIMYLRATS